MPKVLTAAEVARYHRDGFHFPVRVLSAAEARSYRDRLEANERALGGPLSGNMRQKPHLLFTWANELARHPKILDAVEDVIGPDILCWSTTFFTKEAHSPSFVSWHQDATYWGLSTDDVITAWVAFADAPVESGAMKFWPGSHLKNQLEHRDTFDNGQPADPRPGDRGRGAGGRRRRRARSRRARCRCTTCCWRTARAPTRPTTGASATPSATSRPMSASSRCAIPRCWCAAATATAISTPSRAAGRPRRGRACRPSRRRRALGQGALCRHRPDAVPCLGRRRTVAGALALPVRPRRGTEATQSPQTFLQSIYDPYLKAGLQGPALLAGRPLLRARPWRAPSTPTCARPSGGARCPSSMAIPSSTLRNGTSRTSPYRSRPTDRRRPARSASTTSASAREVTLDLVQHRHGLAHRRHQGAQWLPSKTSALQRLGDGSSAASWCRPCRACGSGRRIRGRRCRRYRSPRSGPCRRPTCRRDCRP